MVLRCGKCEGTGRSVDFVEGGFWLKKVVKIQVER